MVYSTSNRLQALFVVTDGPVPAKRSCNGSNAMRTTSGVVTTSNPTSDHISRFGGAYNGAIGTVILRQVRTT